MSVPDIPKEAAQQLFFFPGLQNIDWIPKVDPEPTDSNPFDIMHHRHDYTHVSRCINDTDFSKQLGIQFTTNATQFSMRIGIPTVKNGQWKIG